MSTVRLAVELIRAKRDNAPLSDEEIRHFIAGVTDGSLPDYQISAMLMAIFFRGLSPSELSAWAQAMVSSGDVLDLSSIKRPKIDKHSTGGVGDKISIPLAPAVAACGVAVPMVSGRGLGHTGGTLDKLETIPGFNVRLDVPTFARIVDDIGVCLIGQTDRIAPADRRLYALRDVTGTVESIPLIASSIMSKKLAAGIDGLVLDCKVGSGAFMKSEETARLLCAAITSIGRSAGKAMTCALTDMNAPIGITIGNALEIEESIDVLRGGGPGDTRELTVVLGGEMLLQAGVETTPAAAHARIARVLDDGSALDVFRKVIAAQGGDPRVCDAPQTILPQASHERVVTAEQDGVITAIDSEAVGMAALIIGAGRRTTDEAIDPGAGIRMACRIGDTVRRGDPICTLFTTQKTENLGAAQARVLHAMTLSERASSTPPPTTRILDILR